MNILLDLFSWFANNILTRPEFFVGLIVLLGYIMLKKPIYECFAGFVKATVGYMILNVGAAGLVSTFRPILAGLGDRFKLDAAVIDPYFGLNAVNAALESVGLTTSWIMISLLIGFILNIVLVLLRNGFFQLDGRTHPAADGKCRFCYWSSTDVCGLANGQNRREIG